jgi:hypothetical protein
MYSFNVYDSGVDKTGKLTLNYKTLKSEKNNSKIIEILGRSKTKKLTKNDLKWLAENYISITSIQGLVFLGMLDCEIANDYSYIRVS